MANSFQIEFRSFLKKWWENDLFKLFILVLLWKAFVIFIGIYAYIVMQIPLPTPELSYGKGWDMWARWDGSYYIDISLNGYKEFNHTAFFPLYPFLIHLFGTLVPLNPVAIGMIISHLALWGGLCFIFKLTQEIFTKKIAYLTVFLLLFFPFSLFFGLVYTESLFLFFDCWDTFLCL